MEVFCQATFDKNEKKRRIRFAENENGQVKCDVFEVPRLTDPELWWQKEECSSIMTGCKSLAEHFLHYQDDYVKAIKRLMDLGGTSARRVEKAMECVARNKKCARNIDGACFAHRQMLWKAWMIIPTVVRSKYDRPLALVPWDPRVWPIDSLITMPSKSVHECLPTFARNLIDGIPCEAQWTVLRIVARPLSVRPLFLLAHHARPTEEDFTLHGVSLLTIRTHLILVYHRAM
eukprot:scaffold34919_cov155-Amphora_coffeaeformis.AAC.1